MSATVELPDDAEMCAYCGSRILEHDPICVRDCNDENDRVTGDACAWSPE